MMLAVITYALPSYKRASDKPELAASYRAAGRLSILENATQNSAAAYTASWVSSTSSIPPELRDEPEVPSFIGSAHQDFHDHLVTVASTNFTAPVSSVTEQLSNISVRDKV
ncbi:hypothetical protein NECAME_12656 [Necator americanus]|uniref:Uncharacterized protein n=1 Tax=Necator americanus TaxID=51031 RepID=W2T006_NECAM|nr:hypothetical protein NECAME_12656 [Necator americanus]ETN74889.1 hypothetical protein NECAME_12656 [Necator americanus]